VYRPYTTRTLDREWGFTGEAVAFLRKKGNAFYLVHNVRKGGKITQLHLAKLGERPRITDDVVRQVSRQHPALSLDWGRLREEVNDSVTMMDARSLYARKLLHAIRTLNLDLTDLFPPLLNVSQSAVAAEMIMQLRLLQSTVGAKLDQFGDARIRQRRARRHRPGRRNFR